MPPIAEREKVASVPVAPGVFALRYLSSESDKPPRVFVEVSPASRADVQVVFVPGKPTGMLEKPNQVALVVAERQGHLQLTVSPLPDGGTSARVELEPLQGQLEVRRGPEATSAANPQPTQDGREPIASNPELTCHVARRGDVRASHDVWIGGPDAPALIEGVQIDWNAVDPASLEYQVMIQGSRGQWSPWARAGQFAGTRGRGLPVVALRVRLGAAAPVALSLMGEAAFLGCPLQREQGRELEFASSSGVDPLVGLRLRLDRTEAASAEIIVATAKQSDAEPLPAGPALKVFKSKRANERGVGLGG